MTDDDLKSVLGTPGYMSAEQAAGRLEEAGPASDIYSLGVLLYEILTLELPVAGDTTDALTRNTAAGRVCAVALPAPVVGSRLVKKKGKPRRHR